jgi:hypothetical protein
MGCYAMTPTDYSTFAPFFKKVIGDYHKNDPEYSEKHVNDWDASGVGEGGVLDLQKLGLAEELSMRVRVGRNLSGIPLPGAMTKEDRIAFEIKMGGAFEAVKAKFGGAVYSISPDLGDGVAHPNKIDDAKFDAAFGHALHHGGAAAAPAGLRLRGGLLRARGAQGPREVRKGPPRVLGSTHSRAARSTATSTGR